MTRKLTYTFFVLALLIAGGALLRARTGEDRAPAPADGYGRASTSSQIALWRAKAAADPNDFISRTNLANAYLDHARDVGDLTAYDSARRAIDEALAIKADHLPATTSLAALHFATHEFGAAAELARSILAADPTALTALAIAGDAELELGRYAEASAIYAELRAKAPGPAVWARQARLDLIQGRSEAALDGARRAARESDTRDDVTAESKARAHVQAATYALQVGEHDVAEEELDAARRRAPNFYLTDAVAGRLAATRGKWADAVAGYEKATAVLPEPAWIAALGDIAVARGRPEEAEQHFRTVEGIAAVSAQLGELYNRQLALFLADHDRDPQRAFALARGEVERRQDVYAWDTLAWTAYKAGELEVAQDAAAKATAEGTRDPALLYHAGIVAKAGGDVGRARTLLEEALGIDRRFDPVQAPIARAALAELDGSR